MLITQKSRYGLRAVFELARSFGDGPLKIGEIAKAQAIPAKFLEGILRELKQGRIVDSRRGSDGGYILIRDPEGLTVEDVLVVLQGPLNEICCHPGDVLGVSSCDLYGSCVFLPMWQEAMDAVRGVFQRTTFGALVEKHELQFAQRDDGVPDWGHGASS